MPYTQLLYHLVWATEHRTPLITPSLEPIVYKLIISKATELGGKVYTVNGDEEHVHLISSIPPRIAVATFVGKVKGVTSAALNKRRKADGHFYWQEEYGAFSFDGKCLPNFLSYVQQQKIHHANGSTIPILEQTRELMNAVREDETIYQVEDMVWRDSMMALPCGNIE